MNTSLKKENNSPLLIGLTGGIGSGKSTVANIFKSLGVPVFNSDEEAKIILNDEELVIEQVVAGFGDVYNAGKLDRQKMAELVFNDTAALEKLNNIVHPVVKEYFEKWVIKNHHPILIKEAAILIESGAHQQMHQTILVTAPKSLRIQRVVNRDKVTENNVKERMSMQLSDEEKSAYADYTIVNDEVKMIIPQVLKILERIL